MVYLVADLGAGRCNIVKGHLISGGRISAEIVHSFENEPFWKDGGFVWDLERLYGEIVLGLKKAGKADYFSIVFHGEDGVLTDESGNVLSAAVCRSDSEGTQLESKPDDAYIFRRTGVRIREDGLLYQLEALKESGSDALEKASYLLSIPAYLSYRLTDVIKHEYTWAAATGLVNPLTREWDHEMIDSLALPVHLFTALSDPGTEVGRTTEELSQRIGYAPLVILSPSYAAAAEALAAPQEEESLFIIADKDLTVGVSDAAPLFTEEAYKAGLRSEGGGGGSVRLVKTVPGLGALMKLSEETGISLRVLIENARHSRCPGTIDLSHLSGKESVLKAAEEAAGQEVSAEECALMIIKCIAEGAEEAVAKLSELTGRHFESAGVAGCGSAYPLFMDFLAMCLGITIVSGPESAAAGGAFVSMMVRSGELQISTSPWFTTRYKRRDA